MSVPVSEKKHFTDRVVETFNRLLSTIEALYPTGLRDATREAIRRVEQHFGISEPMQRLRELRRRHARLEREITRQEDRVVSIMSGIDPPSLGKDNRYFYERDHAYEGGHIHRDSFNDYPGRARDIMRRSVANATSAGLSLHPCLRLMQLASDFKNRAFDRLHAVGSHKELQNAWSDIEAMIVDVTNTIERGTPDVSQREDQSAVC